MLYWMQQAQRAAFNPALEFAIAEANQRGLPVVVGFGLTDGYPEANERHYAFMLEGLAEVLDTLERRGIAFVMRHGAPDAVAIELAREGAELVVCDRGYLRHQIAWRRNVAEAACCRVVEVETDVVVPVAMASPKHEVAARTLRPKLHKVWNDYLIPLRNVKLKVPAATSPVSALRSTIDLRDIRGALRRLDLDRTVGPVKRFKGGTSEAKRRLAKFVTYRLRNYAEGRNLPESQSVSELSPYLHFGQISPVEIALAVREAARVKNDNRDVYREELIVRRELAINHCFYAVNYDRYEVLPIWARASLDKHRRDTRPHLYSREQLSRGETHDPVWNAAMREMRETGYMHNRLRMYWGKKILHWSPTPEAAFDTLLWLNNRYFLDGRDPSSYANVGWIFGLHDRPWAERPIFGLVRYMSENTLTKFDAAAYVRVVEAVVAKEKTE